MRDADGLEERQVGLAVAVRVGPREVDAVGGVWASGANKEKLVDAGAGAKRR